MTRMLRILPVYLFLLFTTIVSAQRTSPEFKRFIGQRIDYVQAQLKVKGYDRMIEGRRATNQFYNRKSNRCITVAIVSDKVTSIVDSDGNSCGRHHGNHPKPNPKPQPKPTQPAYMRNADLVGRTATEAYATLKKRRFSETKDVKDGGNTYKLWMNRDGECLKTTSRDGKITSVKASANCR